MLKDKDRLLSYLIEVVSRISSAEFESSFKRSHENIILGTESEMSLVSLSKKLENIKISAQKVLLNIETMNLNDEETFNR